MKFSREAVVITRPVQVECIPDGTPLDLPAGTQAQITQALGSNFTLHVDGRLVRLAGRDADAIGKPVPTEVSAPQDVPLDEVKGLVWQTLRSCYDPEIPVDIVELGLIYVCDVIPIDDEHVNVLIKMTLTAPGCGMGDAIANEVAEKVLALPRVAEVKVDMVFDPPWTRYHMSEAAQLALGL